MEKESANIAALMVSERHMSGMAGYADFSDSDDSEIETFDNEVHRIALDSRLGESQDISEFQDHVKDRYIDVLNGVIEESTNIETLAIGTIGPLVSTDPRLESNFLAGYGCIAPSVPYRYWEGINFGYIAYKVFRARNLTPPRILVRTDANMIALGEHRLRLRLPELELCPSKLRMTYAMEKRDGVLAYLKLSADIALGVAHRGTVWRGRLHPLVHMMTMGRVTTARGVDDFLNKQYSNPDSVESLIGSRAIQSRLDNMGISGTLEDLPIEHEVWDLISDYTATMCVNICALYAPSLIVLGGRTTSDMFGEGVRMQEFIALVNRKFSSKLDPSIVEGSDYVELSRQDGFIQAPANELSGLFGGLVFASYKARQAKRGYIYNA